MAQLFTMPEAEETLQRSFGYSSFRPGQEKAIEAIANGRDVLVAMPGGAGKSFCYQVPGLIMKGLTLIVNPLPSRMRDRVGALQEDGIAAAYLNSTLSLRQQDQVLGSALEGLYDLMYVTPERLADPRFQQFASIVPIPLIAIEDAHCISRWGQDFRLAYLRIPEFVDELPLRPVIAALTPAATPPVRDDIMKTLGLHDPRMVADGYDHPNLRYAVKRMTPRDKLVYIIDHACSHPSDSGIIYCSTRKDVEHVHQALASARVSATRYHAGLSRDERAENQRAFINDDAPVMVATSAFGRRLEKPSVRYVFHYNMPSSLENYYQESSHAGRDGASALCVLLWSDMDISTCRSFIDQDSTSVNLSPEEQETVRMGRRRMLEAIVSYCHTVDCLQAHLLRYFGEEPADPKASCNHCSNCLDGCEKVDVTAQAKTVMRCVQELRGQYDKNTVTAVLRGAHNQHIVDRRLTQCRTFGALKGQSSRLIKEVIELLAAGEHLAITEGSCPRVEYGPRMREVAADDYRLSMKSSASPRRNQGQMALEGIDTPSPEEQLFDQLRILRNDIAHKEGVKLYMVFSDTTLRAMCKAMPATKEELREIQGVGAFNLRRYGQIFLDEINY